MSQSWLCDVGCFPLCVEKLWKKAALSSRLCGWERVQAMDAWEKEEGGIRIE